MASIPNQDTYDPNEAIKRTVKVSMRDGRAINLGQINKIFGGQAKREARKTYAGLKPIHIAT